MIIKSIQKSLYTGVVMLFSTQITIAQQMKMENHGHHHQMTTSSQNIYLSMMDTMMVKMDEVPVTSIPDFDFMAQMIPHHMGAIEMAKYEISHGKNEEMIHLAKSILAEQTSDIQTMKLLTSQLPDNAQKADKSFDKAMLQSMTVMMENMPPNDKLTDTDKGFAMVMIPHHQAAIGMAVALIQHSTNKQVITFAKQLISTEQIEIEQMSNFIKQKP
jgi:uncharacterized protein (DUF305 family)